MRDNAESRSAVPSMSILTFLLAALAAMLACSPVAAVEQAPAWPAKPIRIIVPFGPGGYTDTYARLIAVDLASALGQPVVVENRPGDSGNVGSELVARAAPDGYTLLLGGMNTLAIAPSLRRDLPFDVVRDFTPVAPVVWADSVLLVDPASGPSSVGDLVALARAKPGELSFGSAGNGTPGHLNIEAMKARTGAKLQHVAYKGESEALLALIRGDVVLASMSVSTALPHVRAGKVRAIAVAGDRRSPNLPDVPLLSEAVPGVGSGSWVALFGPAGLPPAVVDRLNREVDRIMRTPGMTERLAANDLAHVSMTPRELADYQKAEIAKWTAIVRESGMRVE